MAISYTSLSSSLEKLLEDPIIRSIYSDAVRIFDMKDKKEQESELIKLLCKYDNHYFVYYLFGLFYSQNNDINAAIKSYQLCIKLHKFVDAYLNLCIIFQSSGRNDIAKEIILEARKYSDDLRILNFLGSIYYVDKNFYGAIKYYKCIIKNNYANTLEMKNIFNNCGFSYSVLGKCEKALSIFDKGLQINISHFKGSHNNNQLADECTKINIQLLQNKLLNYDYLYNITNNIDDYLHINDFLKTIHTCKNKKSIDGKIRIGFISPDLRQHVCSSFLWAIFNNYNKNKFIINCYANVENEDDVSRKIKSLINGSWNNIFNKQTKDICKIIEEQHVDILIDLAGHTNNNRLDVMAKKPAQIQMTYLGFPNTTGLTNIDYRITDKYADPENTTQQYSEKLIRMPRCFICYSPNINLESIPIKPKKHTGIVFGVMNKLNKQNNTSFKVWGEILRQLPNAVLFIKRDIKSGETSDNDIRTKCFKKLNINTNQIKVFDFVSDRISYCDLYNNIDICLDTFPYSGTTTSCDAFLMSTPIITYAIPNRHVSNVTQSMLTNMGYSNIVAHSTDEYIKIAVDLAHNPDRIEYYKQNIRQKFLELMEPTKFANEFDTMLENVFTTN